jgi:outer membrane immunogenic protein
MLTPSLLLGLDLSINYDWANATGTVPTNYDVGPDWKGFVRGRLGWAFDRFLVYGTAGGVWEHFTGSFAASSADSNAWGWTVGGGLEMAFSNNLTGRIDYAYQDFGSFGFGPTTVDQTAHTVTVGVSFKY